jgi:hypothetical protein
VIGKIDSLTEEELGIVKYALRRDVEENLSAGWGVLTPKSARGRKPKAESIKEAEAAEAEGSDEDAEEPTTPVVKIRSTRGYSISLASKDAKDPTRLDSPHASLRRTSSHSRIRRAQSHDHVSDEEFDVARTRQDIHEHISVFEGSGAEQASTKKRMSIASRFSAYTHGGMSGGPESVQHLLPFALVNPSPPTVSRTSAEDTPFLNRLSTFSISGVAYSPNEYKEEDEALEDVFIRKYRWGNIDVLNPEHCDFVPMRTAIFGWGLKVRYLSHLTAHY